MVGAHPPEQARALRARASTRGRASSSRSAITSAAPHFLRGEFVARVKAGAAPARAHPGRGGVTRHLAIVGPTASGKSALALAVAGALGDVEIVSLDSMQVYRGMDIGTAKPSPAERDAVPHHLVDVADPAEEWSVRETQAAARAAVADIEARGRRALLVGGTGLYVRAVVDELRVPPRDLEVRAALERRDRDATPDSAARTTGSRGVRSARGGAHGAAATPAGSCGRSR